MKRNAVAWAALVVSAAAMISSHGVTRTAPAQDKALSVEGQKAAQALSEAFESVAEFVKPSVVQINVVGRTVNPLGRGNNGPNMPDQKQLEELLKRFFPNFKFEKEQLVPPGGGIGTGSGFVYDDQGHILTNNHVVDGATNIQVTFHDGEKAKAKVVGTDPDADVAVIKVDRSDYRPLPKGKSRNLRVGEWVLAIGSPFGLSQTVTAGIISGIDRTPLINDFEDFVQTDAAINPGNSGGPLVDMNGRVVAINSAIATATRANAGVGFAIPIDMASKIAEKLIKDGKISRARVGIKLENITPARLKELGAPASTKGVLVAEVVEDSPAEKAGLRIGDLITKFDNEPIGSVSGFRNTVSTSDIGKSYELNYLRNGKEMVAKVVPAPQESVRFAMEKERDRAREETNGQQARAKVDGYGLSVQPLTPVLARQLGYEGKEGVVVASVDPDGPAAQNGLEAGDLITKVMKDKKPVAIKAAKDLVDAASGDELVVYVEDVNKKLDGQFVTISKAKK
jgi:serine protease Do